MKNAICFRLRKEVDSDLVAALEQVDEKQISDLCRDGLRLMLGIRTTKRLEVKERELVLPEEVTKKAGQDNPADRLNRY